MKRVFAQIDQPQKSEKFLEALETIKAYYAALYHKIAAEINLAKQAGKKLLILIGESHHSSLAFVIHHIVTLILHRYYGVKNVMIETDKTRLPYLEANFNYIWLELQKLLKSFGGKLIPIDLGTNGIYLLPVFDDIIMPNDWGCTNSSRSTISQ